MNMKGICRRNLKFMFFICFVVWVSNFDSCSGRDSRSTWYRATLTYHSNHYHHHDHHHHHHSNDDDKHRNHHHHHKGSAKPAPPPFNFQAPMSLPPPLVAPQPPFLPPQAPQLPLPPPANAQPSSPSEPFSSTFNVLDFGARGDGISDDTQAFQATWQAACEVYNSMILVPSNYEFLVEPISFYGTHCQPNMVFQLDGTIIAPANFDAWGSQGTEQWLSFRWVAGFTIRGEGTIEGSGSIWWQHDDRMPSLKPTALKFHQSSNVTVTGIKIQNSPNCHLKLDNCNGVVVHDFSVSSPRESPNTDGIHLQNSEDVLIQNSNLACGDDCISIQTGCYNVFIDKVVCGPGHGISIGSLGKGNNKACVSNIVVQNSVLRDTSNGVRIKTWQGGWGSVDGIYFSNIQVLEVEYPIVIDQYYCDKSNCKNQTSAVAVQGINYDRIHGTYTKRPVRFACSDMFPCIDINLSMIDLKPKKTRHHLDGPFCWQAYGLLWSTTTDSMDYCLQGGMPSNTERITYFASC